MSSDKNVIKRANEVIKKNPEAFEALVEFEKTGVLPTIEELKRRKQKQ